MTQRIISSGGARALVSTDGVKSEQYFVNAEPTAWVLGTTATFEWKIARPHVGYCPVLRNFLLRFKPKNTSAADTWNYCSIWNLCEDLKIFINGVHVYSFKNNATKDVALIRKMHLPTREEAENEWYFESNGVGKVPHSETTVAVSTTETYFYSSFNAITDIFKNLRLRYIHDIGFEFTMCSGSDAKLADYLTYTHATNGLADSMSLTDVRGILEIDYYPTHQTTAPIYGIPCTKYDQRVLTDYATGSSGLSYTLDISDWHRIANVTGITLYASITPADGGTTWKSFLGLTAISKVEIVVAGKVQFTYETQPYLIDLIHRGYRADHGANPWLVPNDTLVSSSLMPYVHIPLHQRSRQAAEGREVLSQVHSHGDKIELILYNLTLTPTVNRLVALLHSHHLIEIPANHAAHKERGKVIKSTL